MISFDHYLNEVFDSPWPLEDITDSEFSKTHMLPKAVKMGARQIKVFKFENNIIIFFLHEGAYEVHHAVERDGKWVSGEFVAGSKPSVRFIATMISLILPKIDRGFIARIVASPAHADPYRDLLERLTKKFDFVVGRALPGTREGKRVTMFELKKSGSWLEEMMNDK